ncbi:hypothetical protein [Pseudomonas chlororaphis]|uniref:hypothetical protein n=1 Tax=Pseudomonas chlororaphis TaxID=587753 RepID=UPI000566C9F7|nr:hypothetical protein [Pseudomonas chlororaphis]
MEPYVVDFSTLGWFVDTGGACWYFKVADESSGVALAHYFNQAENRDRLDAHRHEVAVEVSSLRLWLLTLRDMEIDVLKYGYKSTGVFDATKPEMIDLTL